LSISRRVGWFPVINLFLLNISSTEKRHPVFSSIGGLQIPTSTRVNSIYKIIAPAKLNICLKVTGRRPDGYHELISIMVPVDLFDHLELKVIDGRHIKLTCDGYRVPTDRNNLVYRAAQLFLSKAGLQSGITINLFKNIPVAAGLGGGSSDAAATLLSLNEIWSKPFTLSDLHGMATGLGADVPFFLTCKPSLARGIGEILDPLDKWPELWYVIVTPPLRVSTSWVYKNLKLKLTTDDYDYILKVLRKKHFNISHILENDLEKVTSAHFSIINTIKNRLLDAGAEGAMMSGSGPSVFGLFPSLTQATSAKQFLISQNLGDVFMATGWERT